MIHDLWSSTDDEAQRSLVAAVASADLVGALLAIEGASPSRAAAAREQLEAWSDAVLQLLAEGEDAPTAMTEVLGVEAEIEGDTEDYYRPANSHLTVVVERRRGMPILLSAVWLAVGRGARLQVDGIALPGHFVARVEDTLVDPFQAGIPLTVEDCKRIVESFDSRGAWDDRWLEPASVGAIAVRVLRNLANAYHQADERTSLYRVVRLLAAVAPDEPAVQLDLAQLTEEMGAYRLAGRLYEEIAERFDGTREARIASIRAVELESKSPTTH